MCLKSSVLNPNIGNINSYITYKQKQFGVLTNLREGNKGVLTPKSMGTADNKLFSP